MASGNDRLGYLDQYLFKDNGQFWIKIEKNRQTRWWEIFRSKSGKHEVRILEVKKEGKLPLSR